ncbi:hypothetical protein QFZ88_005421 [Mesorhizobium sp. YL-MeA3-2017]|nr:hypothetical protein [Mesorhizobium sp. YL-MeA3-2017]
MQVRASLMLQAACWGGIAQARGLIPAGFAATFNTPLAGIVFEEMDRAYESRTNGLVLKAAYPGRPRVARAARQLHLSRRRQGHGGVRS